MPTHNGKHNKAPNFEGSGMKGAGADGKYVGEGVDAEVMEGNGPPAGPCAEYDRPWKTIVGTRSTEKAE